LTQTGKESKLTIKLVKYLKVVIFAKVEGSVRVFLSFELYAKAVRIYCEIQGDRLG
jgi:hypothetical protein